MPKLSHPVNSPLIFSALSFFYAAKSRAPRTPKLPTRSIKFVTLSLCGAKFYDLKHHKCNFFQNRPWQFLNFFSNVFCHRNSVRIFSAFYLHAFLENRDLRGNRTPGKSARFFSGLYFLKNVFGLFRK